MKPHRPNADRRLPDRDRPLASFGLTDRQSRFLVTVMRHAGVFVGRQYAAFAGITHGQKVHDFIRTLLVRRFATSIELGTTGRTRIIHVHHKPLYAAIGEPDNRNRRCVTIDRTIDRLMILDAVLADRSVNWLGSECEKRCYFKGRLGDNLRDNEYPRLAFGNPSWPSQNAFCRAPQTCGSRRRSTTSSGCSSCSSRKGSRTTEFDSIEPPQRHHFSATWRRPRVLMKRW